MPESHRPRAIDRQTLDPDSVLACTRRFLAWRRGQPALRQGDLRFLDLPEPLLGFVRGQAVLALFNLGPEPRAVPAAVTAGWDPVPGLGLGSRGFALDGFGAALALRR